MSKPTSAGDALRDLFRAHARPHPHLVADITCRHLLAVQLYCT